MVASTGLSICLCKTLAKRTTFKLFKLQDRFLIIFVEPWPFGYYDQQVTMTPSSIFWSMTELSPKTKGRSYTICSGYS